MPRSIRRCVVVSSLLALALTMSSFGAAQRQVADGNTRPQGIQAVAMGISVVNIAELARREALNPAKSVLEQSPVHPNEVEYEEPLEPGAKQAPRTFFGGQTVLVASPSPTTTYRGLQDTAQVGTSTSYIPPDTHGAVGLDRVIVTHNNNIRILTKTTGALVSTVSLNGFWSSTGATGVFDPRVLYDPYNSRWIIVATSNASSSSSSICVGVSTSSDPAGSYYVFKAIVGTATLWADYPVVGFNKNWVAVGVNMFTIAGGTFSEGRVLSVNYPSLRGGAFSGTIFTGIASGSGGFCMHPAETFSSTEDTLFLVSHLSSGGATYKLQTMTGTAASPVLTIGVTKANSLGDGQCQEEAFFLSHPSLFLAPAPPALRRQTRRCAETLSSAMEASTPVKPLGFHRGVCFTLPRNGRGSIRWGILWRVVEWRTRLRLRPTAESGMLIQQLL